MSSELYFQAAILGVMLAFLCIMGWRRIVPVLVIGFILGSPSAFASTLDEDNDVPSINEVRDALLAQKLMLDNYFSGYTSPNKLNDISNNLEDSGSSAAELLTDIYTRLDDRLGYSSPIFDRLTDIRSYNVNTSNNTANLVARTFDSDDDVPTLQNIELNITDLDLHNQSSFADMISKLEGIKTTLDNIDSTPSPPSAPSITYAPNPVNTFAENAAALPTPPIESNVTGQTTGFESAASDFTIGSTTDTAIPQLTGVTHSGLLGNPIASINSGMGTYAVSIGNIIKPILTAFLIISILMFTTKTSIRVLAS